MGHCCISIDSVTHHSYLLRLQSMTFQYAFEHIRIRFSEGDVRLAAGGMLDTLADGTAVYKYCSLICRADTVRIGGNIWNTLRSPP